MLKFLKNVLVCSLGAYGGPEAHMGVFMDQMVVKKKYLKEEELIELLALCSILPGPTSTQTIVAVGYKVGGPVLAFLTLLVWALPAIIVMTALSFLYQFLAAYNLSNEWLRYIGPMAVGFIVLASLKIGKKVATDKLTIGLMIFGAVTTYFLREAWVFPLVLLIGGGISILFSKESNLWNKVKLSPPWKYFIAFAGIAVGSILLLNIFDIKLLMLFESFYRFGYLVFGGGQVVVPLMYSELVDINGFMTNQEFMTGYGLVQGLPGPMFSFSAYAGGMASRDGGTLMQILGAIAGGVGIFLPGTLLIFFVYPIWENLKNIKAIKISLKGINAVAGGLIAAAAIILMQKSGFYIDNLIVTFATVLLLMTKKIPAPIIVLLALAAGLLL